MPRLFGFVAIISAVVFFISLSAISYYSAPSPKGQAEQQNAGEPKAKDQAEEQHSLRGFVRFLFPDAISIFTFWLVLATIALAAIAIIQIGFLGRAEEIAASASRAAQEQAEAAAKANVAATDALHQSQRAWVVVDSIEFARPIEFRGDNYEMTLNVSLKNTGNSVATDVFTVMRLEENLVATLEKNWKMTDDDLRDKKEHIVKPSKWPLGIVLAPGQGTAQPFGFGGPTANAGSPSAERVRANAYYLIGLVEYRDQFGITHTTRFSFNPDPWSGNRLVVSGGMQEAN